MSALSGQLGPVRFCAILPVILGADFAKIGKHPRLSLHGLGANAGPVDGACDWRIGIDKSGGGGIPRSRDIEHAFNQEATRLACPYSASHDSLPVIVTRDALDVCKDLFVSREVLGAVELYLFLAIVLWRQ